MIEAVHQHAPDLDITVVVPEHGILETRLAELGFAVRVVEVEWWATLATRPGPPDRRRRVRRAVGELRRVIRDVQPGVVVTNTITVPSAAVAARLTRTPHVWAIHEFGTLDHGMRFDLGMATTARIVGALSNRVVTNSHAVSDHLGHWVRASKLRVVPYAVDVPTQSPAARPDHSTFITCLVGEKKPSKGQQDAVRAIGLLRARGHDVSLQLVGPGQDDNVEALRTLADTVGAADVVELVGYTDPMPYLRAADVVLMCSPCEAFGRVTVEAMKCGRAVVGARGGATPELITDGVTGLLYEPGNAADLAAKLEQLVVDSALAARLGTAAFEAAAKYSLARYGREFVTVLEEVTQH